MRRSKCKKTYTFFLLSDSTASPKKFVVPGSWLFSGFILTGLLTVLGISVVVDYVQLLIEKNQTHWLRTENMFLKQQLAQVEGKLSTLEDSLERVDRFSKKLRLITDSKTPEGELRLSEVQNSNIAIENKDGWAPNIGPIEADEDISHYGAPNSLATEVMSGVSTLSLRIDNVIKGTKLKEKEVVQLWKDLSDHSDLLMNTPTMSPSRGWISSTFGYRTSPLSGSSSYHKGMDIAADIGAPIRSPAHGVVTKVGFDEGYGKHIHIDHGHGIITRYAHCSKTYVKLGQKIKRGHLIGAVGNTGRSTGPHLHYEVRLNGVPVNPQKYILE